MKTNKNNEVYAERLRKLADYIENNPECWVDGDIDYHIPSHSATSAEFNFEVVGLSPGDLDE